MDDSFKTEDKEINDTENDIINDDYEDIINKQDEKEKQYCNTIDNINMLYSHVQNYLDYKLKIYNPNILSNLTKENFFEWIIQNNKTVKK